MKTYAIIPAAGSGRRFGATKQFQLLKGKPVLLHTLEVFEKSPLMSGICVLVPEAHQGEIQELVRQHGLRKTSLVLSGGKERQDSVKKGFEAIPSCDLVIVHDGVRPFVTPEMIETVIRTASDVGACITGLPVKETTKRVDPQNFVKETIDRAPLWNIQTPQAFRYPLFQKALKKASEDGFLGTDEAMLVERIGAPIKVIPGSPYNMKITTPEDLKIAEVILDLGLII
ncbi:MAG: 2-C-methyl-D-erythritol 4-phosphate cytidylyltransferase [Deltaproteobacteria bacterium]|nr:2-C-methyl-D-erythritol 4-phosphate cytidylyltransferase [Deltaproteobacteria bacterium]